jgi:hypothetical protein
MQNTDHDQSINKTGTPIHPNVSESSISIKVAVEQQHKINSSDDVSPETIFSSQKSNMDYVTIQGIENRIGVDKGNIYSFVLKELLDNAIDFLEAQYSGASLKDISIVNHWSKITYASKYVIPIAAMAYLLSQKIC